MLKKLISLVAVATLLPILGICAFVIVFDDEILARMAYKPSKAHKQDIPDYPPYVTDIYIEVDESTTTHNLFFEKPNSPKAILFLHGNAGHVFNRVPHAQRLYEMGHSVLVVDYRGYGLSTGKPSEQGVYADSEAGLQFLLDKGYKESDIIIFARSIGSTAATHIGQHRNLGAIIYLTPLSNAVDMASVVGLGFLKWAAIGYLDNTGKAKNVKSPTLIIHGDMDDMVPYEHGLSLYKALDGDKFFIRVPGSLHNNLIATAGEPFWQWVSRFINNPTANPTKHPEKSLEQANIDT